MKEAAADIESYDKLVEIDPDRLDKECLRLPTQVLHHAEAAAQAKFDLDESKSKLEVVEADFRRQVRDKPGHFRLDKVTEGAINEVVVMLPDYQKAVARVNRAKHNLEIHQAVLTALEHKKRSLTLLVELHGIGYFGEVKPSPRAREAVENITRKRVRRSVSRDRDQD